jgi:hypothetical protein
VKLLSLTVFLIIRIILLSLNAPSKLIGFKYRRIFKIVPKKSTSKFGEKASKLVAYNVTPNSNNTDYINEKVLLKEVSIMQ